MKTRRTMALLAVVLGLLLGRDALAFYNPSTGRWLSRDPVEEYDGANLQSAAMNNMVNVVDFLGLWIISEPDRTAAVRNSQDVRDAVAILIHNMLASRDKSCPDGSTGVIRKPFRPTQMSTVAFMYFTGYFLLGQVAVSLDGSGIYRIDCCAKKLKKWNISVTGHFADKCDELIPTPWCRKKGIGSLPIVFVGEWMEYHRGE